MTPSGILAADKILLVRQAMGGTVLTANSLVNQIADFVLKLIFQYNILYIDKRLSLLLF